MALLSPGGEGKSWRSGAVVRGRKLYKTASNSLLKIPEHI